MMRSLNGKHERFYFWCPQPIIFSELTFLTNVYFDYSSIVDKLVYLFALTGEAAKSSLQLSA